MCITQSMIFFLRSDGFSRQFWSVISPFYCPSKRWKTTVFLSRLQCRDKDLQTKFAEHTEQLIELAQKEIKRASDVSERELALFYRNRLQNVGRDLVKAFVHYHKLGNVELITCNATHAFLPLLQSFPIGVKAQLKVGVENFTKHTGFKPKGIWLAECGYYPGLDEYLKDLSSEGIQNRVSKFGAHFQDIPVIRGTESSTET